MKKPLDSIAGLAETLKEVEAEGIRHLVRYSGTENKLRILLECKDAKKMNETMEKLKKFFEKALNE